MSSTQYTDDSFAELTVSDELRAINLNLAPNGLTPETFIVTANEVATSIQSL